MNNIIRYLILIVFIISANICIGSVSTFSKDLNEENTASSIVAAPPVVNFTFTNDNNCSGTSIQFTSNVTGKGPFKYAWNFGDGKTSTAQNPSHIYTSLGCGTQPFNIILTVTDADTVQSSFNKTINVKQQPDINFFDKGAEIGEEDFSNCTDASIENPNYSITVDNNSTSKGCINSYSIDWGDGTNVSNVTFPIDHEYKKLGAFEMVITAKGSNGCDKSILYIVKNQTNPSGGITSPGTTTDLCAPTDKLEFAISGWGTNSPGTKYLVNYGDGTEIQITQEDMMASKYYNKGDPAASANFLIPHSYTTSSCPVPSYTVNLNIINACSETPAAVGNITIITKPQPDFTADPTCVNSSTLFSNKTSNGSGKNCASNANFTWDFGDGSALVEQKNTLPKDIAHTYTTPGVYNVTLAAINNTVCGENKITKPITISLPPTATITGDMNVCVGDTPPILTFTGASGTPPFTFTYKINNGTNKTVVTPAGNNSATIQAPTSAAGTFTYSLVSVSASGCTQPQSGNATIIVKPALLATITGTDSTCINEPSPRITFKGANGKAPYTFTYNINGGANQTITTAKNDTVSLPVPTNAGGVFKYNLIGIKDSDINANTCVPVLAGSATVTINDQIPSPMTLDNYEFCNGETTPIISFSNNVQGTTFRWTNSNTANGLAVSGSGNIQSFIAKNNTSGPISSAITVIASSKGCSGASQTFTITVLSSAAVTFSIPDQSICSGGNTDEVMLNSSSVGAGLNWTTEQPPGILEKIVLSGTNIIEPQTLTNTTQSPITVIYKAKATSSGTSACSGVESTYTITVNPKPVVLGSLSDTICSGVTFNITPQNGGGNIISAGTKYTWGEPVITPAGSITGAIGQNIPQPTISQRLVNTGNVVAKATYFVTPLIAGCTGNPFEVNIFVIPGASAVAVSDIILCDGDINPEMVFGNIPGGTVYKWSTDNVNIGMTSVSGSGVIPSFTATNTGLSPVEAIITVEASSDFGDSKCDGFSVQFSITVNPTAQLINLEDQNVCSGQNISINFTSENTGGSTTYEWANSNTDIGLAAMGNGNISFISLNNTNSVLTSAITVIPTFSNDGMSCVGPSEQFSITVNPSSNIDQPDNQIICSGNFTSEIHFTGNTIGAVYNWSINNESIGLPSNGTGDIPEFVAVNNESDSIVAIITVIPNFNGCDGQPKIFTITVHPSAFILKQPSSSTVCLGEKPIPLSVIHTNGIKSPNYQWYSNTSNSFKGADLIHDATNATYIPPSSNTNTMYYYCVITFPTGGCSTLISDMVKISVNPNPIVVLNDEKISRNQELKICRGDSIPIIAKGTNTYLWNAGVTGDSIIIDDIGNFRVIGVSQNNCMDTFNFSASYFDLENYTIQSDKTEVTVDENQVEFWSDDIPTSFYSWDFGDGSKRYGQRVTHTYDIASDGYFDVKLEVINPYGCLEETTKRIWVSAASFPNTFTPNGDGINDFYLTGWYKQIFNRNGILMYEGEEGWDGNYKGNPVANDTYFVVIYDSSEKGASYKTNYVTVLR